MSKLASTLGLAVALALPTLGSCTFASTSNQWNGRVGPDGKPVYVKSHTNVGMNLLIFIPIFGSTSLPHEIDGLTKEIADESGNTVRMVESTSENYWYGFPPFIWILTPVITSVSADYQPSAEVLAKDAAEREKERLAAEEAKQKKS